MSDVSEKYDLFNSPELAELYSKHQPPLNSRVIETVLASTTGRELFIDIGCGSGSSTRPFAPHFARVLGVDYSYYQLTTARKLNETCPNVEYLQGNLYELPVPDCSVDCILGVMVAQFIDIPHFYKEVDRVLKPGGAVVFHGKSSLRVAQIESETESKTTVTELNERIVYIKTKLFAGLWHDRTHFNTLKYTNIPELYPQPSQSHVLPSNQSRESHVLPSNQSREEWVMSLSLTVPQFADYMLTWSAAGRYCAEHGLKTWELKAQLVDWLLGNTSRGLDNTSRGLLDNTSRGLLDNTSRGLGSVRCEYDGFIWCSLKPGTCN